jgi:hypothetical protein
MSELRKFLDRVLSGEQSVRCSGEFELLRRVANLEELQTLDKIEEDFRERERKLRSAALPPPPTRADVQRIVVDHGTASVRELEDILRNAKALKLTSREEDSIRQQLARIAGERYRNEGNPSELKRLGWHETPVGPIDPTSYTGFERLRISGIRLIDSCQDHSARGCTCFASIRESLWTVCSHFGETMPESWLASRILDELDAHSKFRTRVGQ